MKTSHNFGAQTQENETNTNFQLPSLYLVFTDQHSLHDTIGTMIINNQGRKVRARVTQSLVWRALTLFGEQYLRCDEEEKAEPVLAELLCHNLHIFNYLLINNNNSLLFRTHNVNVLSTIERRVHVNEHE